MNTMATRTRLMVSAGSVVATLAVAAAMASGMVRDTDETRLDALETRVARLEEVVGISTPATSSGQQATAGEDGEDGKPGAVVVIPGSASSSVSTSRTNTSFTATYSSSGDLHSPLEIRRDGSYSITVISASPITVRITADGQDVVSPVQLPESASGTVSATVELESGDYQLDIASTGQWTVIVSLLDD